jgi:23S rRNA (adenine2503-C2)-methyltransferase
MKTLKPALTDLSDGDLKELVVSLGEPSYRARQLREWLYRGLAFSFEEMTNLPLGFRQALAQEARLHTIKATHEAVGEGGTIKTLFTLADGNTVEAVLMLYAPVGGRPRHTVCVSTQAGCAIGCPFCATGQQGFQRNLTRGEIIDQVLYYARYLKDHAKNGPADSGVANVVFMGMGEPLANYNNLWQAIEVLNSPKGFGLGARNMTISTSGLVPQIKRLGREKLQVGLAVSLHAADNALRDWLVPINKKHAVPELIAACREYFLASGRRVSFEYVLFQGINDSIAQARALARLLQGLNCHVNLIPANPTANAAFLPPSPRAVAAFQNELLRLHINATVRQSRGQDIAAGCGQLRGLLTKKGVSGNNKTVRKGNRLKCQVS